MRKNEPTAGRPQGQQANTRATPIGPEPLPAAMTGAASSAKAAVGDAPVFAYIESLPQPQRGIAERIDALAARTLPDVKRAVKWGHAYYGVGNGWSFSCGAFVDHVKLMFINGSTLLDPVPPVTPIGMGKATRGVELASEKDLDETQIAAWMRQITATAGVGGMGRSTKKGSGAVQTDRNSQTSN